MSELSKEMVDGWGDSYLGLSARYADLIKLQEVLADYLDALYQAQFLTARDCLEALQISNQCWELLTASTATVSLEDRERRQLLAQRLLEAKARVEAASIADSRHPAVSKLLGHWSDSARDLKAVITEEISLGRDIADAQEAVGGSDKLRALLAVECPWLKWDEAQRLIRNAMDSSLAAELDEEFESGPEQS